MPRKKENRGGWNKKYKNEKQRRQAAQQQRQAYINRATTALTIRFNNIQDEEIINKLASVPNKAGYIKELILKDIRKG